MRLEHNDIILRAVEPEDVDLLYDWENDTEWWPAGATLIPYSRHMLISYVNHVRDIYSDKQLRLMIEHKDGATIGCVDLYEYDVKHKRAGVGILIGNREYQHKGNAHDALKALADYAFQTLDLHQLYATIGKQNHASIALFKGCGFVHTATRQQWIRTAGGWEDELFFQLIRSGGKEEA